MNQLKFYGLTDPGKKRSKNEDSLWPPPKVAQHDYANHPAGQLYVVADGMGGYGAGNVASQITTTTLWQVYYDEPTPGQTPHDRLQAAIEVAHERIKAEAQDSDSQARMGTTVVAAVFLNGALWLAWVGDSRAYLLRNGRLKQLTEDHSVLWEQVKNKEISWTDLHYHPQRSRLSNSITAQRADVTASFLDNFALQEGDQILLCSDGLSSEVKDETIESILRGYPLRSAVQKLIEAANSPKDWPKDGGLVHSNGGEDNITALIIHTPGVKVDANALSPAVSSNRPKIAALALVGLVVLLALAGGAYFLIGSRSDTSAAAVVEIDPVGEVALAKGGVSLGDEQLTPTPEIDPMAAGLDSTHTPAPGETPRPEPTSTLANYATPSPAPAATFTRSFAAEAAVTAITTTTATTSTTSEVLVINESKPLILLEDNRVFPSGTKDITFQWQWGNDCNRPPNVGFELRIWKDGIAPMGVMDAVEQQKQTNCNGGKYSLTVGDVSSAPGVNSASGRFNWDVLLVNVAPYKRLSQGQEQAFVFELGTPGGGGNGSDGKGGGGGMNTNPSD
mgnify:CR=1 FL=1